jgi:tetratricopeptide (TPR) repeat protein
MRVAAMALVVAAVAAVLLFSFMPTPSTDATLTPAALAPVPVPVPKPLVAQQPPAAEKAPALEQELAAGQTALAASQPAVARAAFARAALREPGNAAARAGIAASERLAKLLDVYSAGMRAETAGDISAAKVRYAAALALNRNFAPAQAGMARVQEAVRAQAFETALAQGAAALAAGRVDAAETQYQRAATLGGRDARVKEGQQRIAEIRRSDRNARDLARGAEFESLEKWNEALAHYRDVLVRDDSLRFAMDGLARSTRRAQLDRELQDYLDRPDRLVAPAVRVAADRALARGEATTGPTARLGVQLRQLKARLDAIAVKVRVQISSDNSTLVFVAPVGELGIFTRRELELPPGQYAVIGRREGYRDVRQELNITPGQKQAAVTIQCTEKI